ncbi:30S ribosomal protein S1 [Spirochaeta dissipatitropha]
MNSNEKNTNEDSFEALFEKSMSQMNTFQPGQRIETTVVSISNDCVFIELGGKSEGQIDLSEYTDANGETTVKVGDTIAVFFLSNNHGDMLFTSRISGEKAVGAVLENAFSGGIPVEGVVQKEIKGGFEVLIGETRAFCPFSQIGLRRIENPESYVGQHLSFKILEYSANGRNVLVSNRAILEEEQAELISELKKTLKKGQTVTGSVVKIQDFGAFVDVQGVQALLPISEISRSRISDINSVLSVGQEITASIIDLDWERERISLSMKALLADPWDQVKEKYPIDSKHTGTVVRVTNFGAFVSLEPGLDGLLHISEFNADDRESTSGAMPKTGQKISVQINSIDTEQKRISLRQISSNQVDDETKRFFEPDTETYNPFANLLKNKEKK